MFAGNVEHTRDRGAVMFVRTYVLVQAVDRKNGYEYSNTFRYAVMLITLPYSFIVSTNGRVTLILRVSPPSIMWCLISYMLRAARVSQNNQEPVPYQEHESSQRLIAWHA